MSGSGLTFTWCFSCHIVTKLYIHQMLPLQWQVNQSSYSKNPETLSTPRYLTETKVTADTLNRETAHES